MDEYDYAAHLKEQGDRVNNMKADFLKQILIMASALLGALLAFYKKPETPLASPHIFFSIALALLVAGILLLSVVLYQGAYYQEYLLRAYKEQIRTYVRFGRKPDQLLSAATNRIFSIAEVAGYISFSLALIAFVFYVFI